MAIFMEFMGVTALDPPLCFSAPGTLSCAPYRESKGC
jgi:hypothetical protein